MIVRITITITYIHKPCHLHYRNDLHHLHHLHDLQCHVHHLRHLQNLLHHLHSLHRLHHVQRVTCRRSTSMSTYYKPSTMTFKSWHVGDQLLMSLLQNTYHVDLSIFSLMAAGAAIPRPSKRDPLRRFCFSDAQTRGNMPVGLGCAQPSVEIVSVGCPIAWWHEFCFGASNPVWGVSPRRTCMRKRKPHSENWGSCAGATLLYQMRDEHPEGRGKLGILKHPAQRFCTKWGFDAIKAVLCAKDALCKNVCVQRRSSVTLLFVKAALCKGLSV